MCNICTTNQCECWGCSHDRIARAHAVAFFATGHRDWPAHSCVPLCGEYFDRIRQRRARRYVVAHGSAWYFNEVVRMCARDFVCKLNLIQTKRMHVYVC